MIKQVLIKDYILIDELLVEFSDGLNVITGETGAGKSIMINAIDVVFSPRVSKEIIKTGRDKAYIELVLSSEKKDLSNLFEENGIDCQNNEIIISKEISQNAVRSRVNGTLVNQDFIRVLKENFVDIHSQHQVYSFLQPKYHINLLDSYAKDCYGNILGEYKDLYGQYQNLRSQLEVAKSTASATESQIDFLKFQIKEIEEVQITDTNEDETLKNELNVLQNVEKLKELAGSSYWTLNQEDHSILSAVALVKMNIQKAAKMDENLAAAEEKLIEAIEILTNVSSELRDYSQNLDNDTEKLNTIQERIFLLDKIKRKYGNGLNEVLSTYEKLTKEYEQIDFSTQNIEKLDSQINATLKELDTKSDKISEHRKNYAEVLSSLIIEKLEKLELPKVQFKITVEPAQLNANGKDTVEFLISTNISECLKPLAKVASGGEISRVMLAIKTIFAQNDEIDTVIFDEIDTGISGKTSQSVADEIVELSKFHQIILITHQPIIASKADKHFYITKNQENNTTNLGFNILTGEDRIKALAELAGGDINEQSIEFARSLIS
jgi:DNA repair protein RecN (Recombination protein N)